MTIEELLQLPSDQLYAIHDWQAFLSPYLKHTRPVIQDEKPVKVVKTADGIKQAAKTKSAQTNMEQRFALRMMELAGNASLSQEDIRAKIQAEFGQQFLK